MRLIITSDCHLPFTMEIIILLLHGSLRAVLTMGRFGLEAIARRRRLRRRWCTTPAAAQHCAKKEHGHFLFTFSTLSHLIVGFLAHCVFQWCTFLLLIYIFESNMKHSIKMHTKTPQSNPLSWVGRFCSTIIVQLLLPHNSSSEHLVLDIASSCR